MKEAGSPSPVVASHFHDDEALLASASMIHLTSRHAGVSWDDSNLA